MPQKSKKQKPRKIAEIQLIVKDTDGFVVSKAINCQRDCKEARLFAFFGQLIFEEGYGR